MEQVACLSGVPWALVCDAVGRELVERVDCTQASHMLGLSLESVQSGAALPAEIGSHPFL